MYAEEPIPEQNDEKLSREFDEMMREAQEIMGEMDWWWKQMDGDADYIRGFDDGEEQEIANAD